MPSVSFRFNASRSTFLGGACLGYTLVLASTANSSGFADNFGN